MIFIQIRVRGPADKASSCFYFMEDMMNLVEQTAIEVAPGIGLERHFLSPKQLKVKSKDYCSFKYLLFRTTTHPQRHSCPRL